jgi:hypothetical protein
MKRRENVHSALATNSSSEANGQDGKTSEGTSIANTREELTTNRVNGEAGRESL